MKNVLDYIISKALKILNIKIYYYQLLDFT
jgi:hypothetical protein